MSWPLVILSPVEVELADAVSWYEAREPGLGYDFVEAFDATIERISDRPEAYQRLADSRFRRASLRRFPYVVVFEVRGTEVRVVALAHGSRRPDYWKGR